MKKLLSEITNAPTYRERCDAQETEWVKGISYHNDIDDKCCPDFSCCHTQLLTDEYTRVLFKSANEEQRIKLLKKFLGAALTYMMGPVM